MRVTSTGNLITYFENVDDKVEIVFFGDHQPSLNNNFYQSMNGKGLSGLTLDELQELFTVPFLYGRIMTVKVKMWN